MLRFLYLPYEGLFGEQIAPRRALEDLHRAGKLEAIKTYSYYYEAMMLPDWDAMLGELLRVATDFQPTAIFWEQALSGPVSPEFLRALKGLKSKPVIAQRTGDSYWSPPKRMLDVGREIDITFLSGSTLIPEFTRAGCPGVLLLPERLDTVRFGKTPAPTSEPEFDAVMIAGYYNQLWFRQYPGQKERVALAKAFQKRYGKRFGLFGPGWQGYASWQGPIPYDRQHEIMQRSRIVLGNNNWPHADYYSDRLLNALSSRVPVLYRRFPGCETCFRHGEHLWYFDDTPSALAMADRILALPDGDRMSVASTGADIAVREHSAACRFTDTLAIMEAAYYGRPIPDAVKPHSLKSGQLNAMPIAGAGPGQQVTPQ